jgi:hypothetical protein
VELLLTKVAVISIYQPPPRGFELCPLKLQDQTQTAELTPHEMWSCKCYLFTCTLYGFPFPIFRHLSSTLGVIKFVPLTGFVIWSLYWNEISHSWPLRMSFFCVQFLFPTWSHAFLYQSCRTLKCIFINNN